MADARACGTSSLLGSSILHALNHSILCMLFLAIMMSLLNSLELVSNKLIIVKLSDNHTLLLSLLVSLKFVSYRDVL